MYRSTTFEVEPAIPPVATELDCEATPDLPGPVLPLGVKLEDIVDAILLKLAAFVLADRNVIHSV
jgi:hypothetical protein